MNLETLRLRLLSAARANPPTNRVPPAFEKRIMARLANRLAPDFAALWAHALWRAAAACVALTLLLSAWMFLGTQDQPTTTSLTVKEDFSQHFERTMLAGVAEPAEESW